MGERVNIQYSVDIDNLGDEVCRLICDAYENLNRAAGRVAPPEDNVLSLQTIKEIDEVRQGLRDVGDRLGDAVNIINGYVLYKSQMIDQREAKTHVDDERHESEAGAPVYEEAVESLVNLQEQIKQFKNDNEISPQR